MNNNISHEKNIDAMVGAIENEIGLTKSVREVQSARDGDTARNSSDTVDIAKC